jgi:hypothetical protein
MMSMARQVEHDSGGAHLLPKLFELVQDAKHVVVLVGWVDPPRIRAWPFKLSWEEEEEAGGRRQH